MHLATLSAGKGANYAVTQNVSGASRSRLCPGPRVHLIRPRPKQLLHLLLFLIRHWLSIWLAIRKLLCYSNHTAYFMDETSAIHSMVAGFNYVVFKLLFSK